MDRNFSAIAPVALAMRLGPVPNLFQGISGSPGTTCSRLLPTGAVLGLHPWERSLGMCVQPP